MLSQSVWKRPEASVLEDDLPPPSSGLAGEFEVVLYIVLEVVRIDEVLAGVVGRVDVDELDFPGVGFLEELEDFEVVALDHEVLRWCPSPRCPPGRDAACRWRESGRAGGRDVCHASSVRISPPNR